MRPLVTIAIPCLNEAQHIEATVRSALDQRYPRDRIEVLVADGGSRDGTLAILSRLAAEDARLQVIDNPGRIQARAMNEMIRRARGGIIVRLDAHALYPPDYVDSCVRVLEETGADNAGGAQRALAETPFQRALCAALTSPLGMGGASYRSTEQEGWVDTVWLGAYRRSIFETAGLYDPGAVTNEDAELNQRILVQGGRVFLSRRIVAHYHPRDGYRALARQYYRYGMGRARTLLKHRRLVKLRPVLPFAAVATGGALAAARSPLLGPCIALYATAVAGEALRVGRGLGVGGVLRIAGIFGVLHTAHGGGFGAGLVKYMRAPDWSEPERLAKREGTDRAA